MMYRHIVEVLMLTGSIMSEPIRIMGICGTYDLDSANGRMLELLLDECR